MFLTITIIVVVILSLFNYLSLYMIITDREKREFHKLLKTKKDAICVYLVPFYYFYLV